MELCKYEQCTGCMACFNACTHDAIRIVKDDEGFSRPSIDVNLCTECELCVKACPILNTPKHISEPLYLYGSWSKDKKLLKKSSSGGLFSVIASEFLAKGGVVFGAAYDSEFNVHHIAIENEEDMDLLRMSKYIQSEISNTFRIARGYLKEGREVLFTGTPCEIAGLYGYLGKQTYNNLFTCDLLCHGGPSPLIFQKYKQWLEKKYNSKMTSYKFRDKHWGWNGWCLKATFENGKTYYGKNNKDPYFQAFIREYIMRPCCYECAFVGTKRYSDITLADFCGYEPQKGEEDNHNRGISVVIVNTIAGEKMYTRIKEKLVSYTRTIEDVQKVNWTLYKAFPANENRTEFWRDFNEEGWDSLLSKYLYPRKLSFHSRVSYFLGFEFTYYLFNLFSRVKKYI